MIWHSTPESVRDERPSFWALLETILAITFCVAGYFYFGSLTHVAFAAAAAPILLLRNLESTEYAAHLIERTVGWVIGFISRIGNSFVGGFVLFFVNKAPRYLGIRHIRLIALTFIVIFILMFFIIVNVAVLITELVAIIVALAIKIYVIIWAFIRSPLELISNIPTNWRKTVLCTDSALPVEFIPGLNELKLGDQYPNLQMFRVEDTIRRLLEAIRSARKEEKTKKIEISSPLTKIMITSALFPIFVILIIHYILIYASALLYRWSLKSTALIWSPFLWVFRPLRGLENLEHFARGITSLSIYRVGRIYSAFVIMLFTIKVGIWVAAAHISDWLARTLGEPLTARLIVPNSIVTWHLAAAVASILTFAIFFKAERYLHDLAGGQQWIVGQ
jgi:hypothetical protein